MEEVKTGMRYYRNGIKGWQMLIMCIQSSFRLHIFFYMDSSPFEQDRTSCVLLCHV